MTFAIAFPHIDPILLQVGPFAIRWYALAYIAGLLGGMYYMQALSRQQPVLIKEIDIYDFLLWGTLGVIIGGRLGFVIFLSTVLFSRSSLGYISSLARRHVIPWRIAWCDRGGNFIRL